MLNEFRYVIRGKAYGWQSMANISIAKMNYIAWMFREHFGKDWSIEFR